MPAIRSVCFYRDTLPKARPLTRLYAAAFDRDDTELGLLVRIAEMQVTVDPSVHSFFAALIGLCSDSGSDPLLKLVLIAFSKVAGARQVFRDTVNFEAISGERFF